MNTKTFLAVLLLGTASAAVAARADDASQVSGPSVSQPAPSAPEAQPGQKVRGHRQVLERLTSELSLTADQQKSIGGMLTMFHTQARALRTDPSLSDRDRRMRLRALHLSTRESIRSALTPSQQAVFDTLRLNGEAGQKAPAAAPAPVPAQ